MLIRVEEIKEEGLVFDWEEVAEAFPALSELSEAGECTFLAPLRVHLRALRVHEMVEVEGAVETTVSLTCSRCLKEVSLPLAAHFALTFTEELPDIDSEDEDGEGVELSAEEMGLILFQGDEIDLRDAIAEQVVMALPLRPLCDEGCKGLCQVCGADLNNGDCGCQPTPFNAKFAALKGLNVEKK
ncbi:MAG TPA: DUF177 domain-containing protein [Desulfuromonadales bacterium]|nr:DUF177 domain-containing protein [Desulfuromonadales bacterium]